MNDPQAPVERDAPSGPPIPTQDERTMATLAHVLQLVGGCIAPIVIFLNRRESRFVKFHPLQALLLQLVQMIVIGASITGWFALIFSKVVLHPLPKGAAPPAIFFVIPLFWIGFIGLWVLILAVAIDYGIKAGRREWADVENRAEWQRVVPGNLVGSKKHCIPGEMDLQDGKIATPVPREGCA